MQVCNSVWIIVKIKTGEMSVWAKFAKISSRENFYLYSNLWRTKKKQNKTKKACTIFNIQAYSAEIILIGTTLHFTAYFISIHIPLCTINYIAIIINLIIVLISTLSCRLQHLTTMYIICDPTQVHVNEADVIRGPNCDFAVNVFYGNQDSFWHKNHFDTIFHSKDMRKTIKLIC